MTSLDPELVSILVCPETKRAVRPATPDELAQVNAKVRDGSLRNRGGSRVERELADALVREDGAVIFPVEDGIPSMLLEESIPL
ncbi:MAG: hypothetical protein ABFS41_12135 [Myxococcota bacterium]